MIRPCCGQQARFARNEGDRVRSLDGRLENLAGIGIQPGGTVECQHRAVIPLPQAIGRFDQCRVPAAGWPAQADAEQAIDDQSPALLFGDLSSTVPPAELKR